jgi:hypothetical protein
MTSRIAALALATAALAPTGVAHADIGGGPCVTANITHVAASCSLTGSQTAAVFAGSGPNGDGHVYEVRPQCGDDLGGQAICFGGQPCVADDGQPGFEMDLYRDGVVYGETCLSEAQAGGLGAITPGMVLREFRRLSWPESPLSIEPPGLRTAVNLPTYHWTDNTRPTTQTVEIIGQQVVIEASPTSYVYWFDGQDAVETSSPGGPYPGGDVVHEYRSEGSASPSIDTVYSGRYRVNGGRWIDIPETVTVAGDAVTLEVVEVRPTLVAPTRP